MDPNAIRIVNTQPADLERGNTEHIVRVFTGISQVPKNAKLLRGKVVLGFPSYEHDPRPNWQIPAIRRFVQTLDGQLAHFPYFLLPDLPMAHVGMYVLCLTDGADAKVVQPSALQKVLKRIEGAIRPFCHRIADSPEPTIEALFTNLPVEFLTRVPEMAAIALRSMCPLLVALSTHPATQDPFEDQVLALAAKLAGVDRRAFPGRDQLLKILIARAGGASA